MIKPFWVKKKNIDKQLLPKFSADDAGLILAVGDDGKVITVDPDDLAEADFTQINMLTEWESGVGLKSAKVLKSISGSGWSYDVWPRPFEVKVSAEDMQMLLTTGTVSVPFSGAPAGYLNPFLEEFIDVHISAQGFSFLLPASGIGRAYAIAYINFLPGLADGLYRISAEWSGTNLIIGFHSV